MMCTVMIEVAPTPAGGPRRGPSWRSLPCGALGFRIAHVVWGAVELGALSHVWACALLRRRDRYLAMSMTLLLAQGVALMAGRGDCPLGPFQRRLGDPTPMFELALPPRAAKAAIPVLTGVALVGITAVLLRPPPAPPSSS